MASAQFRSDWELGDPPQGRVEKKDSTKSCLILAIPRTIACQVPLSMEFSRQENCIENSDHLRRSQKGIKKNNNKLILLLLI